MYNEFDWNVNKFFILIFYVSLVLKSTNDIYLYLPVCWVSTFGPKYVAALIKYNFVCFIMFLLL